LIRKTVVELIRTERRGLSSKQSSKGSPCSSIAAERDIKGNTTCYHFETDDDETLLIFLSPKLGHSIPLSPNSQKTRARGTTHFVNKRAMAKAEVDRLTSSRLDIQIVQVT